MVIATKPDPDMVNGIYYPSSDGEPLAETQLHVDAIFQLKEYLDDRYAGRPDVFVGCDQFWYWEEGNTDARCAPDVFVAFGVVPRDGPRRSFMSWLENGVVPQFVCEVASRGKWREDTEEKYELYEQLGVQEYFIFDPEAIHVVPPLQGSRLHRDVYRLIRSSADGSRASKVLGVRLLAEGPKIRLIDDQTGQRILTRLERAEDAQRRVTEHEAEIARLRAELEALRNDLPPRG
jgi:Uma2 family endonuclease